ncbi:MAG: ClpXP protease specificity-enhancing factor [Gammaproteobacteria bacterium]
MTQATSKRPYLIRAMHEWMTDNGLTPYVVVDAGAQDLLVPERYISDGKIVLNVSYSATRDLDFAADRLSFEARFRGVAERVDVPNSAVIGIYAQETGQGMIFTADDSVPTGSDEPSDSKLPGRPALKVVK